MIRSLFNHSLILIALISYTPGILFANQIDARMVNVPVTHVYAPAGFTNTDNSEVVITGFLPNLCYRIPHTLIEIEGNKISIGMKSQINLVSHQLCADVIMPFIQTVNIGKLNQGNYQLIVNENSQWEKNAEMDISYTSNNSVQSIYYANVREIVNLNYGRRVLLKGYNPSDCFLLDKIEIINNGSDVYSIFPILKQSSNNCQNKLTEFSYEFTVPENLATDQVLLHVKVMDGSSINALYNNKLRAE